MKLIISYCVGILLSLGVYTNCAVAGDDGDLEGVVAYVLDHVAKSDCTFIRNGQTHSAQQAAQHMRQKYEHFKKDIHTPEDFIRLAGSKSIKTGEDYRVRTKDGKEMKSADWLAGMVEEYRKEKGK